MSTQHYNPAASYGAPIQQPAGKFNPRIGAPEIIALVATTGRMAPSHFDGPSEVKLQLTDGRPWYIAQAMADVIRASVAPNQQIEVTRTGKGSMDWRIIAVQGHLAAADAVAPAPFAVPAERNNFSDNSPHDTPARAQPTQLMACFAQAIDAIQEAQMYANRKGLGITFTSEDVRATAISCWIQYGKGGR
jgi:hypothetical protein